MSSKQAADILDKFFLTKEESSKPNKTAKFRKALKTAIALLRSRQKCEEHLARLDRNGANPLPRSEGMHWK
jgi:hypothetical protein